MNSFFIILPFFPMLMIFYTIYSIEKIYTEKPCFDIKYNALYNQGSQDYIFQNKSSLKDIKIFN